MDFNGRVLGTVAALRTFFRVAFTAVKHQAAPVRLVAVGVEFAAYCRVLRPEGRNVLLLKRMTGCFRAS